MAPPAKQQVKPLVRQRSRSVGESVKKIDAKEKITGQAEYGTDIERDGMLHAAVVRSNRPHARIESVDTSAAEAMEGVEAVVTRTELMGVFDDRVRHFGDVIAAVAAEDENTAREAARSVQYDLEPLDGVFDAREAVREDAPSIHENNPDLKQHGRHDIDVENDEYVNNIDDYHSLSVGDVEDGFERADFVYEEEYQSPRVNHCNLDTHCCLAEWEDGTLVLTETLASPGRSQEEIAEFLGLDRANVRIEEPPTASSSFGGRSLKKLSLEPVAATLADETNRPVRLWFDREEEFVATATRHRTYYSIKTGITDDGDIVAMDIDVVTDTGGYPNGVGHIVLTNSRDRPLDMYKIPNYEYEGVSVFTNNIPGGEYRGIGSTQLGFALESHIEEIAYQAGIDPIELRRRNFVEEGYVRPHTDVEIGSCGISECLNNGLSRFEEIRKGGTDDPTKVRGWGLGAATHTTASGATGRDSSEARIVLRKDGTIEASTAAVDHGQGSDTVMAQIISEETGISVDDIEVERFSTTDELEDVLGSVASRSTYIIGGAVRDAAEKLEEELLDRAVAAFDVSRDELTIDGSTVITASGEEISVRELLAHSGDDEVAVYGEAASDRTPPSYGVHLAEVEVDTETGEIDLLSFVAAQDVGYAVNPKMIEGQLEGAVQHSTEFALYSEVKLENGNPQNANLADYPVISAFEMPDRLECEIIESNEETGPYGAKGIGTPSMPPVAPAILNALKDATGVRFHAAPVDSETVYEEL